MLTVTNFNTNEKYIFLTIYLETKAGKRKDLIGILDTGAPVTEFSDLALQSAGFLGELCKDVCLKPNQATQKYNKIELPRIEICSQTLINLPVYISCFDKSWGIDALIGLDFFRKFKVTINYKSGSIITTH